MRPFTPFLRSASHLVLIAILLAGFAPNLACTPDAKRDLLVVNASIWGGLDDDYEPEAFVVRDGRFLYVGSNAEARKLAARNARILNAEGRRIVPGIIDAHMHLLGGGKQLAQLDLRDVADRDAFIWMIQASVGLDRLHQGWLLGGRWSTESWPDPAQPTRFWIDKQTQDVPVLLHRMDGHAALANAVALDIAGIDANGPPDPDGGTIERDPATGEPTGILKDSAIELVAKHVPDSTDALLDDALDRATTHALQHGITCVHTMEDWRAFETFNRARKHRRLPIRIRQFLSEPDWEAMLPRVQAVEATDMLRIVGFKEFADGSLGSRTAYMAAPYSHTHDGDANARGLLREAMHDPKRLETMCRIAYRAGYAPAIHAIGDEANHEVLDIYERVVGTSRRMGHCSLISKTFPAAPRIEHAQHLLPSDIARFAKYDVTASMQPLHKADDGRYAVQAIGAERCRSSYAYRSLIDAGALVCFGSDWPVVSLDPLLGVHAAVTGATLDGKTFVPEENITVAEALAGYTLNASKAANDSDLGQIDKGCHADFVILDRDVLTIPKSDISNARVLATFVAGVKRFER